MRFTDLAHLVLMLSALALAYVVPFELLLLAYVVLGPAHYATEISWLHDRNFFLPQRSIAVGLAALAVIATFIENAAWFGIAMWGAFVICAAMQSILLFMAAIVLTLIVLTSGTAIALLGILLPTLVHVSLFTLVFMTLGAYRSGEKAQWLLVAVYLAAIGLILVAPPTATTLVPSFAKTAEDYFGNVGPALGRLLGLRDLRLDTRLTSLLAFVYTYHYLNWFIKAEVIRWTAMSGRRLALVAAASGGATALYFYDYALGFTVLLAFSLVHIVLEFPLDTLALRQLGSAIGASAMRIAPRG